MSKFKPNPQELTIVAFKTPSEATNYYQPEFKPADLEKVTIVGKGTVQGLPTVDFIFRTEDGQKYVAMLTGALMEQVADAIKKMKELED